MTAPSSALEAIPLTELERIRQLADRRYVQVLVLKEALQFYANAGDFDFKADKGGKAREALVSLAQHP